MRKILQLRRNIVYSKKLCYCVWHVRYFIVLVICKDKKKQIGVELNL